MSDRNDPRVRELTYRMMDMAPDAPPFPEEAPMKVPEQKQRPPILVWAAAAAAVVLLVGVPLILFRGGGTVDDPIAAPTTSTVVDQPTTTLPGDPTTTVPPAEGFVRNEFAIYLFADEMTTPVGDPALVPVSRFQDNYGIDEMTVGDRIPDALEHLFRGGGDGYSTSIPEGISEFTVSVGGDQPANVVSVDLPAVFESGGGTMAMTTRLAQVVFTATQFEGVDSVLFMIDGEIVDVFSGEGLVLDGPQTRDDYTSVLPAVFLDTPAIGSIVESPVRLSGIADTFEDLVVYEIVDAAGTILGNGLTPSTCGDDCFGEFSVDVGFTVPGETTGEIVVYETETLDGDRVNELRYSVTLLPGGTAPPPTTTVPPTTSSTTTTLPGEASHFGPAAGQVVGVVGVAHDDVLNVRQGPGARYEIVTTLDPLAHDVVGTGRNRFIPAAFWSEVESNGVVGWVNQGFIAYLGTVDDATSRIVDDLGGIPEAETMLELGTIVAESLATSQEGGSRIVMVVAPTVGDVGEVTFDVIGLADDSQYGLRVHVFGQPTDGGDGFSLMSAEETALCGRGVTEEGFCI